ncbi:hypothetical protein DEGR_30650 [Deinococcus grandis]|nr:hypothetical protein DEGR_30650 [Deinococcus grandis]
MSTVMVSTVTISVAPACLSCAVFIVCRSSARNDSRVTVENIAYPLLQVSGKRMTWGVNFFKIPPFGFPPGMGPDWGRRSWGVAFF